MKAYTILFFIVFTSLSAFSQKSASDTLAPMKIRQYWFVMIKTGPKTDFDSVTRAGLFAGHMSNIQRLHKEGILKVAGPFGKNDFKWRGIFIFDCETKEEAEKYTASDPAVQAGLFAVDIVPWYTEAINSFQPGKPEKN